MRLWRLDKRHAAIGLLEYRVSHIWVHKLDGSEQCGWTEAVRLTETRAELANIIDETNIIAEYDGHVPLFIPTACGYPTGGAHLPADRRGRSHPLQRRHRSFRIGLKVWEPLAESRTMAEGFALPCPFPWPRRDRVLTTSDRFASYATSSHPLRRSVRNPLRLPRSLVRNGVTMSRESFSRLTISRCE